VIQVDKAITSATSVTPSKLSLGEGNGGSALKALGDPNTPGHTETWTSPVITLAR
jgi:hypothetical protein